MGSYPRWIKEEFGHDITTRTKTHYDSVAAKVRDDFATSPFWTTLTQNLQELDSKYLLQTGYPLFVAHRLPELQTKSYTSFLLKTYRKNVVLNESWPEPPPRGWIHPANWFSRINDMVRTLLTVKYLDGVQFIVDEIRALCGPDDIEFRVDYESKEEGYYAAHTYIIQEYEIPQLNWDTKKVRTPIEIQVTTQLQDVIRLLLHEHYERRRERVEPDVVKWQWDYNSQEFATNYLGHILHYVEGMIVSIRSRGRQ